MTSVLKLNKGWSKKGSKIRGEYRKKKEKVGKMVKFDTIKLKFDSDMVESMNTMAFDTVEKRASGDNTLLSKKMVLNNEAGKGCLGLKNIELYCQGNEGQFINNGTIELSAKILKENYYDLINRNTIEQVIDTLNNFNLIKLNKNKFLDKVEVLRADITENLKVRKEPAEYIDLLQACNINYKYRVEKYSNEAVVFKKNVLSYRERMIFYDKFLELSKNFKEAKVLNLEKFKNVLRCENNITSFKRLRKNFNLQGGVIYFKDLLSSQQQVNYNTFKKITEGYNQVLLELFSQEALNLPLRKVEILYGQKSIIKAFDYDLNKILAFIKLHYKSRTKAYQRFKEYKKVLETMRTENKERQDREFEAITEIKELLKVA